MTIREVIMDAQDQMLHEMAPAQARDLLVKLTAWIGNALVAITETEHRYRLVLLKELSTDEPANRATIRAQVSLEYVAYQQAKNDHAALLENVRSLKQYLKSLQDEMQLSR